MAEPQAEVWQRITAGYHIMAKGNWRIGLGIILNFTCYYAFFPGVTLFNKLTFLNNQSNHQYRIIGPITFERANIMTSSFFCLHDRKRESSLRFYGDDLKTYILLRNNSTIYHKKVV